MSTWARRTVGFGPFFVIVALVMCYARAGYAQTAPPSHARLELIADLSSRPGRALWVGVLFHLDPGWHIYWQNPGDSGTSPRIQWDLPARYRAAAIQWPTPKRLGSGSIIDYGYEGQVLLMAYVDASADSANAGSANESISADVKYVVCSEICIPGKARLTLPVRNAGRSPSADMAERDSLFQKTVAELPKLRPESWRVSATQDKEHFVLAVRGASPVNTPGFLPLDADQIENSAPQVFVRGPTGFSLTLKKSDQLAKPISELRGLIVVGPGQAYEIAASVSE